ncbi:hypothetical protein JCM9140_1857 [Halalkalibacter wakoensis JCM 9140]|uniref:RDD domain-containing protein n=1 Tax=Halalkalibacter wakoensis JCM 9140 TaxID=1236970 RepID=W4Q382_9BACI|nr:RDD family protein [Halalkalibacter wakoensis]GAE25839.1 hypothetical protein JCM9140_1857 [Halalkalibacter wakoensis JCM 9140]
MSQVVEPSPSLHTKRKRVVNGRLRHRMIQETLPSSEVSQTIHAENEDKSYYYAGFWMRLWAFLLDMITVFSLNGLLVYPLLRWTNGSGVFSIGPFTLDTILSAMVFFLYFAIMTKLYGQTIGKMVMGLRVRSSKNEPLSWTQIVFREGFGRFIHQAFFLLYAIYLMIAFTKEKRGFMI